MGSLRKRIVVIGEEAAPRGRIMRMQLRVSVDLLITLLVASVALAAAAVYQLLLHRRMGRRSSWL